MQLVSPPADPASPNWGHFLPGLGGAPLTELGGSKLLGPDSQSPTQLTIHKKYLLVDGSEAQQ